MTEADAREERRAPGIAGRRRRLLFRIRRAARVVEQRERLQEFVYGLLLAAFVLALPAAEPAGPSDVLERLEGEDVVTQGLLYPIASGAVHAFGAEPEHVLRVLSATLYGLALSATLAFLRRLGFRRTSSLPAALAAFLSPAAWWGATSPTDYGPGVFGAAVLLWSLFRLPESVARGYQWRAILLLGLAFMLRAEAALLLPAVAWAVSRHPVRPHEAPIRLFSVYAVFMLSVAIGLSGPSESTLLAHLAERTLAGGEPSLAALARWPLWFIAGFGATLLGLYALLFARRESDGRRAPRWLVPWCLVALAPVAVGSPEFGPIGTFLVPAGALGLADWLNRRGERSAEARWGTILLAAQVVFLIASQRTLVR